jgi:hypothetical protein
MDHEWKIFYDNLRLLVRSMKTGKVRVSAATGEIVRLRDGGFLGLRTQWWERLPERHFYFNLEHNHWTVGRWKEWMAKKDVRCLFGAEEIMSSINFCPDCDKDIIRVVVVMAETYKLAMAKARKFGGKQTRPEVACLLLKEFTPADLHSRMGMSSLFVVHKPQSCCLSLKVRRLLRLRYDNDELRFMLTADEYNVSESFGDRNGWAFEVDSWDKYQDAISKKG